MRVPTATYRVQLGPAFGFKHLAHILDYLAELGISDIYAAPVFKARPGSAHGYDVVDTEQMNRSLGSSAQWRLLSEKRRSLGMGWVQDIVPNHMAYSGGNPRLAEVLARGVGSRWAGFFDIDWQHPDPALHGRVSAPFLGDTLRACLERGEIRLGFDAGGLFVGYFEHRFPLALPTYARVLSADTEEAAAVFSRSLKGWLRLAAHLSCCPPGQCDITAVKKLLWRRHQRLPAVRAFVAGRLNRFNSPAGREAFARLLASQVFHLDCWRTAGRRINYRRFFSINGLIAVRQERPENFAASHELVARLAAEGRISGLRVDHVDGLLRPGQYLARLRERCPDCFIVVEKITGADEFLPRSWPVQGDTGYGFAAHLDRLFTDADHAAAMDRLWADFCGGDAACFAHTAAACKALVLQGEFMGDLENLTARFSALPHWQDGPPEALADGLAALLVHLPVYRTYLADAAALPAAGDRATLCKAVAMAVGGRPELKDCLVRLERLLAAGPGGPHGGKACPRATVAQWRRAVGGFEQLSAALTAKGVEDTALYRHHRLTALNEVGQDPGRFGEPMSAFHRFARRRLRDWPGAFNALSTHDSKRCGDVRARLLVLSEMPEMWRARVFAWRELNRLHIVREKGRRLPDRATEYLCYQTLAGTFSHDRELSHDYVRRMEAYLIKAVREAKVRTDWANPDPVYEKGIARFVRGILQTDPTRGFVPDLRRFVRVLAGFGHVNALAQTLIQLTAPGVPDIFQGTEVFDDSLVDPDNRRPVDYERRRRLLARATCAPHPGGTPTPDDPDGMKLLLIHVGLALRRRLPELFYRGAYRPLKISGQDRCHVVGFARSLDTRWALTVVPRLLSRCRAPDDGDGSPQVRPVAYVRLPVDAPARWRHLLTGACYDASGGRLEARALFTGFPVALLVEETGHDAP